MRGANFVPRDDPGAVDADGKPHKMQAAIDRVVQVARLIQDGDHDTALKLAREYKFHPDVILKMEKKAKKDII